VVTGAAQGIGRAICQRFLDDGGSVVAFDVNRGLLEETAAELGERCSPVVGDVSVHQDCTGAVRHCVERFGRIDVMVAHCGIAEPLSLLEQTDEHWRRHQAINVDGVMYCTVDAARAMVAAGRPGAIVVTASINGFHVEETMAAYNTTKGALLTFIRSAAIDLGRHGIRVNGVAPGVVDTPIAAMVVHNPQIAPIYLKTMPLGRFGQPNDIANAVAWLSSPEAAYVTGQTIVIDGGQTLGITGDLEGAVQKVGP
jgi:NAD(P)-dependent dehydrogenase (short-subunit alcohol dehydrogenase family)